MWSVDPDTRNALRLDRIREAMERQDWEEAVLEIEELLDDEPQHAEALFLLGESLLESGDPELAVQAYVAQVKIEGDDVPALLGLAIAQFESCELVGCIETAREVIRIDPSVAEAHWYLGLALELVGGREAESIGALASARQLEPDDYPWPLDLTDQQWEEAVLAALAICRPGVQSFWEEIPVMLVDRPKLDELRSHSPPLPPTVSGLFLGELDDEADPHEHLPDAMRLYRKNLALCRTLDELVMQVSISLESECMGWLGLLESDADSLG